MGNHTDKNLNLIRTLIRTGSWMHRQGWCPASSGNLSARIDQNHIMITASGCVLGSLSDTDLVTINTQSNISDTPCQPSAETLLHIKMYQLDYRIGTILHTHSIAATLLSRIITDNQLYITGYEMQKALSHINSHRSEVTLAIFDNSQDMSSLAEKITQQHHINPIQWGFLLRSHGLYVFGKNPEEAQRHLECLEFLIACELQNLMMQAGSITGAGKHVC